MIDKLLEWCWFKKKEIAYGGVIVLLLSFIAARFVFNGGVRHSMAYGQAEEAYHEWLAKSGHDLVQFAILEDKLSHVQEQRRRLDALIAQRLLNLKESSTALPYAQAALGQFHGKSAFYRQFAENGLMIIKGALPDALKASRQLWKEMEPVTIRRSSLCPTKHILYALNLVRIAALEQQLHHQGGELEACVALLRFAEQEEEVTALLRHHLKQEKISLYDYLEARKRYLSNG